MNRNSNLRKSAASLATIGAMTVAAVAAGGAPAEAASRLPVVDVPGAATVTEETMDHLPTTEGMPDVPFVILGPGPHAPIEEPPLTQPEIERIGGFGALCGFGVGGIIITRGAAFPLVGSSTIEACRRFIEAAANARIAHTPQ